MYELARIKSETEKYIKKEFVKRQTNTNTKKSEFVKRETNTNTNI